MSRRIFIVLCLALVLVAILAPTIFAADSPTKQIGLVIVFPDGKQHLEIVTMPGTATTYDVLAAAKVDLVSKQMGFGPAVCSINAVGCPATNCFCDAARFWAYFDLDSASNKWVYSQVGVGGFAPANGAVVGFAWSGSDEKWNPTVQPPVYTFAQIIAATSPQPVPVPEPGTLILLGSGLAGLAGYVSLRLNARR